MVGTDYNKIQTQIHIVNGVKSSEEVNMFCIDLQKPFKF